MTGARRAEGEVSEREELLDGRLQLVLDGETADGLAVSFSLVWLLGREGATPLAEGFATLAGASSELNASLASGEVEAAAETGEASVRARFAVDAAEGGASALAAPGAILACGLEVGAESWRGELRIEAAPERAGGGCGAGQSP